VTLRYVNPAHSTSCGGRPIVDQTPDAKCSRSSGGPVFVVVRFLQWSGICGHSAQENRTPRVAPHTARAVADGLWPIYVHVNSNSKNNVHEICKLDGQLSSSIMLIAIRV
jgi:hypothetical protein